MIFRSAFLIAALMGVFLTPLPSAAQSEYEVVVSNIDRGFRNTERRSVPIAQAFTTGNRYGGYSISSVEISYADLQGDEFSAAIHAVGSDGFPTDTVVLQLETEDDFSSSGDIVFTPVGGPGDLLDRNTKYAVRVWSDGRDVDYLATYRGGKLDCRVPLPCTIPGSPECEPHPGICTNATEGAYGWDGWKINPQLALWKNGGWTELDYLYQGDKRRDVALLIRINAPKVPGPPTNFNAVSTSGAVILRWSPPEPSGVLPVTRYRYRSRLTDNSADWSSWKIEGKRARSARPEGLTKGKEYKFQLQAGNVGGWSEAVLLLDVTWVIVQA